MLQPKRPSPSPLPTAPLPPTPFLLPTTLLLPPPLSPAPPNPLPSAHHTPAPTSPLPCPSLPSQSAASGRRAAQAKNYCPVQMLSLGHQGSQAGAHPQRGDSRSGSHLWHLCLNVAHLTEVLIIRGFCICKLTKNVSVVCGLAQSGRAVEIPAEVQQGLNCRLVSPVTAGAPWDFICCPTPLSLPPPPHSQNQRCKAPWEQRQ